MIDKVHELSLQGDSALHLATLFFVRGSNPVLKIIVKEQACQHSVYPRGWKLRLLTINPL